MIVIVIVVIVVVVVDDGSGCDVFARIVGGEVGASQLARQLQSYADEWQSAILRSYSRGWEIEMG